MVLSCRGATQAGERWNTVRDETSWAIAGIICAAVAPVPIIPTRLPSMG